MLLIRHPTYRACKCSYGTWGVNGIFLWFIARTHRTYLCVRNMTHRYTSDFRCTSILFIFFGERGGGTQDVPSDVVCDVTSVAFRVIRSPLNCHFFICRGRWWFIRWPVVICSRMLRQQGLRREGSDDDSVALNKNFNKIKFKIIMIPMTVIYVTEVAPTSI